MMLMSYSLIGAVIVLFFLLPFEDMSAVRMMVPFLSEWYLRLVVYGHSAMKRKSNAGQIDASRKRDNVECLVFNGGVSQGYPEIGVVKWRCISVRNTGVLCGLAYYLLLGLEETITSSYFPVEARKRGLSPTEIGVAVSMMEAGNFCFSFLIMLFITPNSERLFCVSG